MISNKRGAFLLVLALFLVLTTAYFVQAESSGCYVYPQASEDVYCQANLLESEAQKDCTKHTDCDMKKHFLTGSDCTTQSECADVICNVDCQTHAWGKCEQLGTKAGVPATKILKDSAEEDLWCTYTSGCCRLVFADKDSCLPNLNKYQCELKAQLNSLSDFQFFGEISDYNGCIAKCGEEISTSTLSVKVDDGTAAISGVIIKLEGTSYQKTTDAQGKAEFPNLQPNTYLLSLSKSGYNSASKTLSLDSGKSVQYNFTLSLIGEKVEISGMVSDENKLPLEGVQLSWSGPIKGKTTTDKEGKFSYPDLPKGEYTFTASKKNYNYVQQKINLQQKKESFDFQLQKAFSTGISGTVYLDLNNNKKIDLADKAIPDAHIYVDEVFKGYSQYEPAGKYEASIILSSEANEKHTITATYQEYGLEPLTVEIAPNQMFAQNLLLSQKIGECSENGISPKKNVEKFAVSGVPGKKEVHLTWEKPCAEVVGYKIEKSSADQPDAPYTFERSPSDTDFFDVGVESDLEWGNTYTYKIIANYISGLSSEIPAEQTITLGDKECEGKYHEDIKEWETFCLTGEIKIRKKVWTCDNNNKLLLSSPDCAELSGPGEDYYCAKTSAMNADCKDAGSCSANADPFGLYGNRNACYGISALLDLPSNFCYFDYTPTIVDQCQSCAKINSCFDYQSKSACEMKNSCFGEDCAWVDGAANQNPIIDYSFILPDSILPEKVTLETGSGYCVEKNYAKDNRCSLCSPASPFGLFENYFCTAQVCSGLGNCFSAEALTRCQACGDNPSKNSNCYAYATEFECIGNTEENTQGISQDQYGKLTASKDRCSWKACAWSGISGGAGKCIKDGNADQVDDCSSFSASGELANCHLDISAPVSKIVPEGINVISLAHPNLTVTGSDEKQKYANQKNKLGLFGYCLTSAKTDAPDNCMAENFVTLTYPGKLSEETLTLNLINSIFLTSQINGETYKIKYYSQDKYFNREQLRESFVFVDNVAPPFEIKEEIETEKDLTKLDVHLEGTEEPMSCTFVLKQLLPAGESQTQTLAKDVLEKKVLFENLLGIKYELNVTCTDEQDNINSKAKLYVFDKEQDINLVYPQLNQVIGATSIEFKVTTTVGATCSLYLSGTNQKVADFVSDEIGKEHKTELISLLELSAQTGIPAEGEHSEFEVFCTELYSAEAAPKEHTDYFLFKVDLTSPSTKIILKEGQRTEKPSGYGWESYFIEQVEVSFECTADGFSCDKINYCLGEGCELIGNPYYEEYKTAFLITNSTKICYYSTDIGGNSQYQLVCGKVIIDGYGITLEKPELYFFEGEQWGVSNQPTFDWSFFTKVPSTECGIDFSSGFDYIALPEHKLKLPDDNYKYLFTDFPASVFSEYSESGGIKEAYVKCKNVENEIGPEAKMYLEYDPTPPQIWEVYANPNLILENVFTTIFASTDDKTVCRFSDNSSGEGSSEYSFMEFMFPGLEEHTLFLQHEVKFDIASIGNDGKKNYSLLVGCANGAGNTSEIKTLDFKADYTAAGYIFPESLQPSGYTSNNDITLGAATSKSGNCEVKASNLIGGQNIPGNVSQNVSVTYVKMESADSKTHSLKLGKLQDAEYNLPVKCKMQDHLAEAAINFVVDTKPAVITSIEDGNYTCGLNNWHILIYTNETKLNGYYYELYDMGLVQEFSLPTIETETKVENKSKNTSTTIKKTNTTITPPKTISFVSSKGILVLNASVGPGMPLEIKYNFNESHKYIVKAQAFDAAGNVENLQFKESDGFIAVPKNSSVCKKDNSAPVVTIVPSNTSCTNSIVELLCSDATSCAIKYGISYTSTSCVANKTYNGEKITFNKNGWLCYAAQDGNGKNISNIEPVMFKDTDGDKVGDVCDKCISSSPNSIVDKDGCSAGDTKNKTISDKDIDGLPDDWEKEFGSETCLLDFASPDTDGNGIVDGLEDYDNDGADNLNEYLSGTDPCVLDVPPKPEPEPKPDPSPTPKPSEEFNLLAWVFLLLGLLLVLGGVGYLIYYYKYSGKAVSSGRGFGGSEERPAVSEETVGTLQQMASWKDKLFQIRRERENKSKQRQRSSLFETFSQGSSKIPHVDKILSSSAPIMPKLQQVAQKYAEHKDEIKPGLKPEEKSIFSRLESIAKQTKDKTIHEVVDKEEAQDLFSKLKEISKKRKEK